MARLARAEVFAPDEIAIVRVMNRVVHRCFLLGTDAITGKNFDHRKVWITGKVGSTPTGTPPVFARLAIDPETWCKLIGSFGRLFCNVAGRPQTINATRSRINQRRYHVPKPTRKLLPFGEARHRPSRLIRQFLGAYPPHQRKTNANAVMMGLRSR